MLAAEVEPKLNPQKELADFVLPAFPGLPLIPSTHNPWSCFLQLAWITFELLTNHIRVPLQRSAPPRQCRRHQEMSGSVADPCSDPLQWYRAGSDGGAAPLEPPTLRFP